MWKREKLLIGMVILAIWAAATAAFFIFYSWPSQKIEQSRQAEGGQNSSTTSGILYKFEDYPARKVLNGSPAPVDFSTRPEARTFKTAILGAVAKGVDFAGHYKVASWGCGTSCQMSAIIDLESGRIVEYAIGSALGLEYRVNSRLLIVNPPTRIAELSEVPSEISSEYYELTEAGELKFLAKQPAGKSEAIVCAQVITTARNSLSGQVKEFPTPCSVPWGWEVVNEGGK